MAKISVIVTVHNSEEYLERCLNSILEQSFDDFKLIIVNDGSTDRSRDICEAYKEKDTRIKIIDQEHMGSATARNMGIKESKDDFITFVDSDDYIHKDMLKTLYRTVNKHKSDISVGQFELSYENIRIEDEELENDTIIKNNREATDLIVGEGNPNMILAIGKLYRRSLFEKIDYPEGKYNQDEFVTYKLLYRAKRVVINTDPLYYYTQSKSEISEETYGLKILEKLQALKEAIDFFEDLEEKQLETRARMRLVLSIQIDYYKVRDLIGDQKDILKKLKEEYDLAYKEVLKNAYKLTLRNKIMIRFFKFFPEAYCAVIKTSMKKSKKTKK